jgi:hypothetical protein
VTATLKFAVDLDRCLGWAVGNVMKVCTGNSKAVSFTRSRVKETLKLLLGDRRIPEASSCKYLEIILRSDLRWADQVNYRAQNAWKAIHFIMRVLMKGNSNKNV